METLTLLCKICGQAIPMDDLEQHSATCVSPLKSVKVQREADENAENMVPHKERPLLDTYLKLDFGHEEVRVKKEAGSGKWENRVTLKLVKGHPYYMTLLLESAYEVVAVDELRLDGMPLDVKWTSQVGKQGYYVSGGALWRVNEATHATGNGKRHYMNLQMSYRILLRQQHLERLKHVLSQLGDDEELHESLRESPSRAAHNLVESSEDLSTYMTSLRDSSSAVPVALGDGDSSSSSTAAGEHPYHNNNSNGNGRNKLQAVQGAHGAGGEEEEDGSSNHNTAPSSSIVTRSKVHVDRVASEVTKLRKRLASGIGKVYETGKGSLRDATQRRTTSAAKASKQQATPFVLIIDDALSPANAGRPSLSDGNALARAHSSAQAGRGSVAGGKEEVVAIAEHTIHVHEIIQCKVYSRTSKNSRSGISMDYLQFRLDSLLGTSIDEGGTVFVPSHVDGAAK